MALYVLLSPDQGLQAELESCLGGNASPPKLIQVSSLNELETCIESLQDVEIILADSFCPLPPESIPFPVLVIGKSPTSPYPVISRPVYAETLQFSIEECIEAYSTENVNSGGTIPQQLDFLESLLGEILHDLNNQFTTLRGNIPFLKEIVVEDDGTIEDIHQATEKAASLLHLLEGTNPDSLPDIRPFSLELLLRDLRHFCGKMLPGCKITVDPVENLQAVIQGDSELICTQLLRFFWMIGKLSPHFEVIVKSNSENVIFQSDLSKSDVAVEELTTQLSIFSKKMLFQHISPRQDLYSLICSLKLAKI